MEEQVFLKQRKGWLGGSVVFSCILPPMGGVLGSHCQTHAINTPESLTPVGSQFHAVLGVSGGLWSVVD